MILMCSETRHSHGAQSVAVYFEDRDPVICSRRRRNGSRSIDCSHGLKKMEGLPDASGYVLGSQFGVKDSSSLLLMSYRYRSCSTYRARRLRRWSRSGGNEITEHISRHVVLIGAQSMDFKACFDSVYSTRAHADARAETQQGQDHEIEGTRPVIQRRGIVSCRHWAVLCTELLWKVLVEGGVTGHLTAPGTSHTRINFVFSSPTSLPYSRSSQFKNTC